jgi:hypothetical protein
VAFVMRASNHGEGGILALMALSLRSAKSKSSKSKSSESIPHLTEEEITMKRFIIKRDLEELENQINIGSSIPKFSELKDIECSRADLREEEETIGLAALGVMGGKTRKYKKPLKKKTNTRNKNKTKKAKKSKKTIKHRNKIQKKHKKTR